MSRLSFGVTGSDEKISAAKIDPLGSETKYGVPHDMSDRGACGTNRNIDQARIRPTEGNRGQYQHPESHADDQGVIGRDETVDGAKIDPLVSQMHEPTRKNPGLDDEQVDTARVRPLGEVREELRPDLL